MKAVILAGGEGTRLRPLTSNQPKPMMPLANRPMMEHIVKLLAQHGFDDIVVTVAFLANQIRDYFGDGSDFGVAHALRHRGLAARHRGVGAQRRRRARRDVPRHLRRRAHRHRPHRVRQGAPRARRARRRSRSKRVENPLEFGIVITQPDGTDRAVPREADVGPGVLRHDQHRHLRARARGLRLHPRGRGRRLLGRRVPRGARQAATRSTATSSTATGRTSARSRRTSARTPGRPRRAGARSTSTASSSARASGSARAPTIDPDARDRRPGRHRRQLPHRGRRATLRAVHRARHRRRREGRRVPRAGGAARPRVRRAGRPPARLRDRPHRPTSARNARVEEGVVVGDECFVGEHAVDQPGREDLPVQDRRGRRGRHLVDRVGEPRRAHAVRPPGRARARQRRHHARGRGAAGDGVRHRRCKKGAMVTTSRDTSRIARALEAGGHRRPQPRRRQRRGRRARDRAAHALPGAQQPGRRAASPCGSRRATPTRVEIRFFDADGRDIDEATQRKIERLLYREDYRRAFARRHRRHRVPAPLARVLHGRARADRRHRAAPRAGVQGRARLLVRRGRRS